MLPCWSASSQLSRLACDGVMRVSAASKHMRAELLPMTVTAATAGTADAASAAANRVLPMLMIQVLLGVASIAEIRESRHQLMALHRVAELVVGEGERGCGLALVPPAPLERRGEDRFFIFGDGETEVGAARRIVVDGLGRRRQPLAFLHRGQRGGRAGRRGRRLEPGRFERIELDGVDGPRLVAP